MSKNDQNPTTDSQRSRLKDGALAATALAVGTGAAASTAAAQDDEDVVITAEDYYPDVNFDVVAQYESGARDNILEAFEDEFDDSDDWEVYAIEIDVGGSASELGHLLADEEETDVSEGDSGTFDTSASFRNSELGLLEVDPGL
ncbi:hypothetical protein SAMN05444422_11311 [Halobiforma haloterrestris]|uniref:Uncharacterized protein n=1 Tax=Natronobacterium haloterrestre TaxID=148448 RepID=A0A1I1KW54_NATHA|nr:calcium-binding protein [Halobiforma haloterrestris]SFC64512.1 hypothetical protein SAMN05444422_11311 [Halobiforma haloterrestris]